MVEELNTKCLKGYGITASRLLELLRSGQTVTSLSKYCPTKTLLVSVGECTEDSAVLIDGSDATAKHSFIL